MSSIYNKTSMNKSTSSHTPQSQPIPGMEKKMVRNDAGGYVFKISDLQAFKRFLILGTESGTFYANSEVHTERALNIVQSCLKRNAREAIDLIVEVSNKGKAVKNDPAIFALAVACSMGNTAATKYALAMLPTVARTGTHLFQFVGFLNGMRSWGRAVRRGISNWYLIKSVEQAGFQMAKYQNREGWSHKDIIRQAHPNVQDPEMSNLFKWALEKPFDYHTLPPMVKALEDLKPFNNLEVTSARTQQVCDIIKATGAPFEIIPTKFRNEKMVWEAMLPSMGLTAMMRNLSNMTRYGVFDFQGNVALVVNAFRDRNRLSRERIHPIKLFVAKRQYESGVNRRGERWNYNREIAMALEYAFYASFEFVPEIGKKILVAIDDSGSMSCEVNGIENLSCEQGAALMAMAIIRSERPENYKVISFDTGYHGDLRIKSGMTFDEVLVEANRYSGGTDCSLPVKYALDKREKYDAIITLTDNETWAGRDHAAELMRDYRRTVNPECKFIEVAMSATSGSIYDPEDFNSLSIVGMSTDVPAVVSDFIK